MRFSIKMEAGGGGGGGVGKKKKRGKCLIFVLFCSYTLTIS